MQNNVFTFGLLLMFAVCGCNSNSADKPPEQSSDPATSEQSTAPKTEHLSKLDLPPLPPAPEPVKKIYAKSFINKPAPKFVVEQWLTTPPEFEGKMVLIDFWATWCQPCLKSIPKLNQFHRQHKDRLVVVGVSDETEEEVRSHKGAAMNYAVAIDPSRRMYDQLGIQNIPHLIIVDPTGIVRWEGFPAQPGHELTEEVIEELLDTYVR